MARLDILHYPDGRLHTVAKPVAAVDARIRRLVDDMAETMYAAPGIGLAATQVNVHERVVVIDVSETHDELRVFINPEIVAQSGREVSEEGCLSVPGIFDKVARAERVTVRALDREGKPFELAAIAVHRVGACRVAAAGARGKHHRVMAGQQLRQRIGVELLDVGRRRGGPGCGDFFGVVGIAEHRGHLVPAIGEDAAEQQGDLPVTADNNDVCHGYDVTGGPSLLWASTGTVSTSRSIAVRSWVGSTTTDLAGLIIRSARRRRGS